MTASVSRPASTALDRLELARAQLRAAEALPGDPADLGGRGHVRRDVPAGRVRILEGELTDVPVSEGRRSRLTEQRRNLPDGPGVYLFRDARQKVIYVGKAKSIRKRVAATSPTRSPAAATEMVDSIESVEFLLVGHRDRGAARRAELHQAVPAALQHPAARRQVLSVHRDLDGRGVPARLLHARAPPARPACTSARTRAPSARAATLDTARQGLPVPLLPGHRARAGAPARRAWTTTSSAAGRPASATSRPRGVPRVDRRRHRVPQRPLPRDRARPRGAR